MVTPVKHCINLPLINFTLCSAVPVVTSNQSWILTNLGKNWPGWPLTFLNSTNLPLWPLSVHWPLGSSFPSEVSCLHADSFGFYYFNVCIYTYLVSFCLSVAMAVVCGLVAQRLNEECVQKPFNGADSLWGNKPSHWTPQMPQHRLAPLSPAQTLSQLFFCRLITCVLFCFIFLLNKVC